MRQHGKIAFDAGAGFAAVDDITALTALPHLRAGQGREDRIDRQITVFGVRRAGNPEPGDARRFFSGDRWTAKGIVIGALTGLAAAEQQGVETALVGTPLQRQFEQQQQQGH